MRITIAYSKIKKRNLVLINNDTHQRETVSERPIRPPLTLNESILLVNSIALGSIGLNSEYYIITLLPGTVVFGFHTSAWQCVMLVSLFFITLYTPIYHQPYRPIFIIMGCGVSRCPHSTHETKTQFSHSLINKIKRLSVIVNSKLHFCPNPNFFAYSNFKENFTIIAYLCNNSFGNSIFLE